MAFKLTEEQDKELFPLCEETELGHVLRNRRMKIVRQRTLELFFPKLPPFFQKNFIPLLQNLKSVLGGSLLVQDSHVGGSTEPKKQVPMNSWAKELANKIPPVQLAPEADFTASLFPTTQPLSEGGSAPVAEFNTIYVDIVFPYDVPVPENKRMMNKTGSSSNSTSMSNAASQEQLASNEEKEGVDESTDEKEIEPEWNNDVPLKTIEKAPTSESSKTWIVKKSNGSFKRFARVFVPPPSTSPKPSTPDSCTLFLNDWHPEFISALKIASEKKQAAKQQQQNAPASSSTQPPSPHAGLDSPTTPNSYQPQVTGWILDVIFRGYDEQNFIQIKPGFSSTCETCLKNKMSFSFSPITVRQSVINKVALLSTGHILLLDAIRHKVYGRINLDCWFTSTEQQQQPNEEQEQSTDENSETTHEQQQQQQQQQPAAATNSPPLGGTSGGGAVGPIPFNAESSSSLLNAAATGGNFNNNNSFMNPSALGSFSTEPTSSTSFSTLGGVTSPLGVNASIPLASNQQQQQQSSPQQQSFEEKLQHFFDHVGLSFVGNQPNEPNRFMSLGVVVVKSEVKTYEHACDADCPLSFNDVLYPEMCSKHH